MRSPAGGASVPPLTWATRNYRIPLPAAPLSLRDEHAASLCQPLARIFQAREHGHSLLASQADGVEVTHEKGARHIVEGTPRPRPPTPIMQPTRSSEPPRIVIFEGGELSCNQRGRRRLVDGRS